MTYDDLDRLRHLIEKHRTWRDARHGDLTEMQTLLKQVDKRIGSYGELVAAARIDAGEAIEKAIDCVDADLERVDEAMRDEQAHPAPR